MQKIGDTTKTADSNGEFTDGDPQKQIPPTWIMAAWLNTLQREVIKVVQEGGLTLNPKDDTQLYQAIEKLVGTAVKGALPLYPDALTTDLNTLGATTQAGVYCQPENAGATTAKHYPVNLAGTLMVTPSAYGCQQEYTTYSTRQKFVRGLTGPWNGKDGPWSDWASPPAYGWGMGPQHRDDAYNNVAMLYRVNGTSVNAPGPNVYGVISLPCDGGPSTSYLAIQNSGRAFVGYSNLPANGVIWTEVYTVKNPPTAAGIGAVKKTGDMMTGQLIAPSFASTPEAMPNGAGAYADQLSLQASFFQPNWQWPVNAGGIFVPIAKGTSTRKDKGYPGAVSFGYLMPANDEHPHPTIHVKGDSNVDTAWDFNPYSGGISSKEGTFATREWVNANTFNGGNHPTQSSISGNQWWYKDLCTGMIFQGGYAEGQNTDARDRIALNISVPNRLLYVSTIIKNYAQGYDTTYNPQVGDLTGERDGFWWFHGAQERVIYWMAVGY
ncbi:pyocin knob domain-containing protein [Serratia marcescens]|uniref:pyocin knob domain-containing protein n=1 Tax=Serratia marcescens TaxID=615 RepID=UPI001EEFEA36|nr:pyocin knob domain-containing protein [Serratia marcescens]ULH12278.1 pyocin knob domain-containing protein [Serratia marcescens]